MSNWIEDEVIDTPETEIVEENIYMDENLIKNKALIRMDMNIIQYPLFSKNTKRKINQIVKYYFNKNHDTYINVSPMAGDYIPGEGEEKVFIALMKIMKKKGMPRKFIVTAQELKEELKINSHTYAHKIKESLSRLTSTNYKFKNTMYSSKEKMLLSDEIETTILSLRTLKLNKPENEKIKKEIKDNRIKEVYEISISTHFYENIMTKGYLVYNSDILLSIDTSTARTIYMLIEKLRYNELYLKIDTLFLIKRIPLKFNPKNPSNTIKILEKNLNELKNKKLIESFNFIKESTWEKSEIEIFFDEECGMEKQERFFGDLNDFRKISTALTISDTEHDVIINTPVTQEMIEEIYHLLPESAKKLKSIVKTIKDSADKYGSEKVKGAVLYMKKQKNLKSPRAFFLKTLENDWAKDEIVVEKRPTVEKSTEVVENFSKEKSYYEALPENEKQLLEDTVYREYIKECGQETKIQKLAFKAGKNSLVYRYLSKTLNIVNDIQLFNDHINRHLELYKVILSLSEERINEIKKDLLKDLGPKFVRNTLTLEEIDRVVAEKIAMY